MGKIQAKESQNVEYKRNWQDEYLKWICGFANAQGAVMYFGVDDDHKVCGLKNTERLMEDIPNKVVSAMGIVVDVNLHEQDGLEYIEVVVSPNNVPISYRGKYYYRSGSTMQELNGAGLQQFILKKMGRTWDDIPNEYATVRDLDRKAIKYFLENGIAAQRIAKSETKASTQHLLENLGLVTEDGKLKNAALLLFAKNPRRYFTCVEFKIGRFRHDESDLIIQDVIEGNIMQMTDRVVEVLKAKYLTSPIHYEGMKRREPLEVPEDALREILYNAIAHKDYMGAPIQMRVWDDYVEIWNEGELPVGYTPETLLKKHSSKPRNKNIANAFFKAGFIESWGRGYEKIKNSFENAGLPMPKIESADGGVRVTFQRDSQGNAQMLQGSSTKSDTKSSTKSGIKSEDVVLAAVKRNPVTTLTDLMAVTGLSKSGVRKVIDRLKAKNLIQRVGPLKGGHWEIIG